DLMRFAHPDQIEIELSLEDHFDAVVAVERKVIRDRNAAARSERQFLAGTIVLRGRGGNANRVLDRGDRRVADREPADRVRRRHVVLEKSRGDREHTGDVVESLLVALVGWQQRASVYVERQQIANGVGVLGPVQAVNDDTPRMW